MSQSDPPDGRKPDRMAGAGGEAAKPVGGERRTTREEWERAVPSTHRCPTLA